jgi:antitoxin component of RelBE/YafQ-DinJ toxin-antitoxin module
MYDNKMRLSQDVLEKAEQIASEWGLKNSRAAIEAVFRKYADEYLYGRLQPLNFEMSALSDRQPVPAQSRTLDCEALDELDDLLGM